MQITCKQTGQQFEITDADQAFYQRMQVPPPTLCPAARHQRRTAFRNERSLYQRKCSATGKSIVSTYPQSAVFPVFDQSYWWGDEWDARDYGQDFDFSRPFFEQFQELMNKVPRFASTVSNSENCQYNNFCDGSKNCYLSQRLGHSEDAYYSYLVIESKDIFDCYNVTRSQKCYEVIDGENCYNVKFSQNVSNCSDSAFLFNCRGCRNCFMCSNLRSGQYYFQNKKLSKEEYKAKLMQFAGATEQDFQNFLGQIVVPEMWGAKLENAVGNYLSECKNVSEAFDCRYCEDVKFSWGHIYGEDCMDTNFGYHVNQAYEFAAGANSQMLRFCFNILNGCYNLTYCMDCVNSSHDLFGCLGIKHGEYCILNKQYTRSEYEDLLPRIIKHMQQTGEWGEFFPIKISPFAYNETVANEYFPLSKEQVLANEWSWKEDEKSLPGVIKTISAQELPSRAADLPEDILQTAIRCGKTGRLFKFVQKEAEFYKENALPLPHLHPDERYKNRVAKRAPRVLVTRECEKCGKQIRTSYGQNRPEIVYCTECYLSEVY